MTDEKLTPAEEGEKAAAKEAAEKTLEADERREYLIKTVEKMLDLMERNPNICGSFSLEFNRHSTDKILGAQIRFYNYETEGTARFPHNGLEGKIDKEMLCAVREVFANANLNL